MTVLRHAHETAIMETSLKRKMNDEMIAKRMLFTSFHQCHQKMMAIQPTWPVWGDDDMIAKSMIIFMKDDDDIMT